MKMENSLAPTKPPEKPVDHEAVLARVMREFSKTLEYLAKN